MTAHHIERSWVQTEGGWSACTSTRQDMKGDTNSRGTVPFTTNMAHMGRPHPQSAWGKGRREGKEEVR